MGLEFRPRNYTAEAAAATQSLPRLPAEEHPLSAPHRQENTIHRENSGFIDPLRRSDGKNEVSGVVFENEEISFQAGVLSNASNEAPAKEWLSFRKILMQRFPVSKTILSTHVSSTITKSGKDDPQKFAVEGVKVMSHQDYMSRLGELKEEIAHAWHSDDRVTSLKLSVKVARLLMDTATEQFYPTLFLLATDVLDMVGDFVWERIKRKVEFSEDGRLICSLPDNFEASAVNFEAKETCTNWFSKIGAIHEVLPRIYLELAILPCWCFLLDRPMDSLQRLVMMTRGIADPLASAYCRLYMVHRAQKLPQRDQGYLITCINDIKILLTKIESTMNLSGNSRLLLSLMQPTIEYIVKILFKDLDQVSHIAFGDPQL